MLAVRSLSQSEGHKLQSHGVHVSTRDNLRFGCQPVEYRGVAIEHQSMPPHWGLEGFTLISLDPWMKPI